MALIVIPAFAFAALAGLSVLMAAAWAIQRATQNSGWIDVAWTFGCGFVGVGLALAPSGAGAGWRQAIVAGLAAAWSLRLGLHIVARTRKSGDDPRYRKMIEDWGDKASSRLFLFLQGQAVVGAVIAVAIAFAAHAPGNAIRIQDVIGIALIALAIVGEAVADAELAAFKANPANRGAICDAGLWRLSRHPNYFCEFLVWLGFALVAFEPGDPRTWIGVLAPAIMYATLRYASGVPPLEERMKRTHPKAFAAYAEQTPEFFPRLWPARKAEPQAR